MPSQVQPSAMKVIQLTIHKYVVGVLDNERMEAVDQPASAKIYHFNFITTGVFSYCRAESEA